MKPAHKRSSQCSKLSLTFAFSLAAMMPACAHDNEKQADEPQLTPQQQAMQQRAQSAAQVQQAAQDFAKQRQEYHIKAENQLNQLEAKIAALKASAPTDMQQRQNYQTQVSMLEGQLQDARIALVQLKSTPAEQWLENQQRVEQSILTADAAYQAATQRLSH